MNSGFRLSKSGLTGASRLPCAVPNSAQSVSRGDHGGVRRSVRMLSSNTNMPPMHMHRA